MTDKNIEQRRSEAFERRKRGMSFAEIARQLREEGLGGDRYSRMKASRDVKAVLDEMKDEALTAEQMRTLLTEILFVLWSTWGPRAMRGDVDAARIGGGIIDRLSRLHAVETVARLGVDPGGVTNDAPSIQIVIPDNGRVRLEQMPGYADGLRNAEP